tara:strand:- start:22 stop:1488 length:1467 start_codon:yes stop_codon:yes gene_type:complete
MAYFTELPNLSHISLLPDRSNNDERILVKNFFKRAKLREDVDQAVTAFDYYEITENTRPDSLAQSLYGDSGLDWVILITNNITNVRDQWPLSNYDLDNYISEKYTVQQAQDIHHYETTEVVDEFGRTLLEGGLKVDNDFTFTYTKPLKTPTVNYIQINLPSNVTIHNGVTIKQGEVTTGARVQTIDASDPNAYQSLLGTSIEPNGSGEGDHGGFAIGNHLAFRDSSGTRRATLKPIDSRNLEELTIKAIVGNDSNGGEEVNLNEDLIIRYKIPGGAWRNLNRNPDNTLFDYEYKIINIDNVDADSLGTLTEYSIYIPEYAREDQTLFQIRQLSHSGFEYDHYGITEIKFTGTEEGMDINATAVATQLIFNRNYIKVTNITGTFNTTKELFTDAGVIPYVNTVGNAIPSGIETVYNNTSPPITINPVVGITNYKYEVDKNESKRRIKILKVSFLPMFISEMKAMMRYDKSTQSVNKKVKETYNPRISGV